LATENKYKYTRAYFKILNLINGNPSEDVFLIKGGQGSSKTISILELIIQALLVSPKEATVLSSELSKMKRTSIMDYKKICTDWGVFKSQNDYNRSESKHEYPNGSYLDFLGADVTDVGKGFRRDILYINEANKMPLDTAVQFISRCDLTLIDWNPDSVFWGDDYINENNCITLTFDDNEYLGRSERKSILGYKTKGFHKPDLEFNKLFEESNIKSNYWANRWRVYGLGLVGQVEGAVYKDWKVLDSLPDGVRLLGTGLDFGFTNDPTAAIDVYKWNDAYILDEVLYRKGLHNNEIYDLLKDKRNVYADSAEPKSISELRRYGLGVRGAVKGRDSIMFGVQILQSHKIFVTSQSTNLIEEMGKYSFEKDKRGQTTNKPADTFNHCMDAARYAASELIGNKNQGKYRIARV